MIGAAENFLAVRFGLGLRDIEQSFAFPDGDVGFGVLNVAGHAIEEMSRAMWNRSMSRKPRSLLSVLK